MMWRSKSTGSSASATTGAARERTSAARPRRRGEAARIPRSSPERRATRQRSEGRQDGKRQDQAAGRLFQAVFNSHINANAAKQFKARKIMKKRRRAVP